MSADPEIAALSRRELVELWTVTFGEPPPVVHDPPLMVALVESALMGQGRARLRKVIE